MIYQLELTQEARLDVEDAWYWYESKRTGLGEEFLISLKAAINKNIVLLLFTK
jgi:hypothetical protein